MRIENSTPIARSRHRLLAAPVLALLVGTPARAQEGRMYYPAVETHLIPSKHVAQTFKIDVMQPAQRREESRRFPVVYATDGNLTFDMFKGISYLLQTSERNAPPFILVGIGYPSGSPVAGSVLRARELTFPGYPKLNLKPPTTEGVLVPEKGAKDQQGAPEFQRFIEDELIPLIDRKYRTIPGDRTYFGHSAGGGFGLYTLFTKSDLFRKYIVSSPGLVYHGESAPGHRYDDYDFVLRDARKFISSGKSLPGVRVYMSVGTEEEFQPGYEVWQLTSSFYRMARLMKAAAIPGLEFMTEVFPGENHETVWPLAFMHGVQAVFGTGAWRKNQAKAGAK